MNALSEKAIISRLEAKINAQQKTIDVLMNAAEDNTARGSSSLELLAQNLNLERIIQNKTDTLKRQGEQLKEALHDLQATQTRLLQAQKLESVGQLAAGIAHEINTPVQFISSNIDFLEQSFAEIASLLDHLHVILEAAGLGRSDEQITVQLRDLLEQSDLEYLKTEIPASISQTKDGIKRVATIVHAMKDFSHPSSKEKVAYNLNKIIETTVLISRNEWKYGADLKMDLDSNLPSVPCLVDELGQVILNLIMNAAQAIDEKNKHNSTERKEEIRITTKAVDSLVEIRIQDTGAGIPSRIQDRIFDPFFTTKEVGKGTGQGLAISHDVITKKHSGTLTFETEEGVGTTFIIRLPIGT
jgi:two-component system, NtrC family, sensor kinase